MNNLLQNKKVLITLIVVMVLLLALVAAIVFGRNSQEPVVQQPNVRVELTWWNAHNNPIYDQIARDFSRIFTNVRINIVDINYENEGKYYKNLLTEFARGTAPDIFTLRNDDIPAWREFISPLKDLGTDISNVALVENYKSNFVPLVLQETLFRDQIYAVTNYVDNLQIYYNEDILNQASLPLRPSTWVEMEEQVKVLNRRQTGTLEFNQSALAMGVGLQDINGDIDTATNVANFYDIIPALIFQNGNPIYDKITERSVIGSSKNQTDLNTGRITEENFDDLDNEGPTYTALRYFLSYAEVNNPRYSWSLNSNNSEEAFLQGKLAYLINYRSFQNTIKEKNSRLQFGVSELPQLDPSIKKTYGQFFADVMNRQLEQKATDNPDNLTDVFKYFYAKRFMYYLTQQEVQEKILAQTGLPAAHKSIISKQQQGDKNLAIFANGSLFADNYYKPNVRATERMWGKLLYKYHYENVPLKKALAEAISEYSLLIQQGPQIGT